MAGFTSMVGLLCLAICHVVLAQQDVASRPFALVLKSANDTLDGTLLSTCHEGAAIEGLCPTYRELSYYTANASLTPPSFTFNTSEPSSSSTTPPSGLVIYSLRGSNFNLSSPLSLAYNPTSNVAIPLFMPSDGDQFVFDGDNSSSTNTTTTPQPGQCGGLLGIQGYVDDTKTPIVLGGDGFVVRRWYVCQTYYGYRYTTLAWALGTGAPQNPTCVKVEVERVYL